MAANLAQRLPPPDGELLSDDLLDRFLAYVADEGLDALPGAGGGDPRADRRQERHPQHADRLGQVAGRDGVLHFNALAEGKNVASTRARSRRW